mmetsp:Transcript_53879/g.60216  ORF Transcript_53879/g.60216 Transcript_53879/m.60216 type:complete len:80 (+) Transcript_53879:1-240(+)
MYICMYVQSKKNISSFRFSSYFLSAVVRRSFPFYLSTCSLILSLRNQKHSTSTDPVNSLTYPTPRAAVVPDAETLLPVE